MKKKLPGILIGLLLAGFLATSSDEYIEVNRMTGSYRSRMRYAYLFNTQWKTHPTWMEESAARQGISTSAGWGYLSVVSKDLLSTTHACGKAPASYLLPRSGPDALELKTNEEIDTFVRDFIHADEEKRKQMLSAY